MKISYILAAVLVLIFVLSGCESANDAELNVKDIYAVNESGKADVEINVVFNEDAVYYRIEIISRDDDNKIVSSSSGYKILKGSEVRFPFYLPVGSYTVRLTIYEYSGRSFVISRDFDVVG